MSLPIRTCVGCRARGAPTEMVRLCWDGAEVVVSRTGHGRGAWIHPHPDCLAAAQRRGVLFRAFRGRATGELQLPGILGST